MDFVHGVPGAAHETDEARFAGEDLFDLNHHGDVDLVPGAVDLAVNVRRSGPPAWLAQAIMRGADDWGSYPDDAAARRAIAERHGVPTSMVLPTAGAAEAFGLIARTLRPRRAVVVHPQFTEPEAALRRTGVPVERLILPVTAGAPAPVLDVPAGPDALFVGNPTNPTGWLHPRRALIVAGADRLLVVDEAFMDAADERESLVGPHMPGMLVLRSLSKTWGLAGLRVGYVVGDAALIAILRAAQAPWPVSSPALIAMEATASRRAVASAQAHYRRVDADRAALVRTLEASGFPVVHGATPFILVDTSSCGPASVREPLAAEGFAVRRGETFPGLGPTWIRVKVPERDVSEAFVRALIRVRDARTAG